MDLKKYALENYSDSALEQELERRRQDRKPKMLQTPDLKKLKEAVQEHIEQIHKSGCSEENSEHYIFEEAMMAFYGDNVFIWINENEE